MIKNDQWDLPGGKLKKDELLQKAIRREVREETGLEINDFILVTGSIESFKPKGKRLGLIYFAESKKTQIRIDPMEHSGFQWLDVKKIHDKNFAFKNTVQWIEAAKKHKIILGETKRIFADSKIFVDDKEAVFFLCGEKHRDL